MINRQIVQDFLFFRTFRAPKVCVSYRLLQIVLFLTDSIFRVLFAYFDASMASKIVYMEYSRFNTKINKE